MKKILLISLTFLFLSCSSSSDDNNSKSNISINPPTWIQGTWVQILSTSPLITSPTFRFKNNDFCTLVSSGEFCNAENLKISQQVGAKTEVKETSTANEYEVSMTMQSSTVTYKFIKISNTKIEYINPINGLPNLELIKQ